MTNPPSRSLLSTWGHIRSVHRLVARTPGIGRLWWLAAISLVFALLSFVPPLMTRDLIDRVIPAGRLADLIWILAQFAVLMFALLGIRGVRSHLGVTIGVQIEQQLRADVYRQILAVRPVALASRSPGELITALINDIEQIRNQSVRGPQSGLTNVILAVGALALLAYQDLVMALVATGVAALSAYGSYRASFVVRARFDAARSSRAGLMNTIHEQMHGFASIHSHGVHAFASARLALVSEAYGQRFSAAELTQEAVSIALAIPGVALTVLTWSVCSYLALTGQLSLGTLIMCVAYLGMVIGALNAAAAGLLGPVARSGAAAERLSDLLSIPVVDERTAPAAGQDGETTSRLAMEDVDLRYSADSWVLRGVSLQMPDRGVVHVSGPSGAGKTSLLRLLHGLIEPTRGRVLLDGVELERLPREHICRKIGSAWPEDAIFSCSLADNILLGRDLQHRLPAIVAQVGLLALLSRLPEGLETPVGKGGVALSTGERSRVSLARALLGRPRILILDEALSNLDLVARGAIIELIQELARGMLIIIATHDPLPSLTVAARLEVGEGRVRLVDPPGLYTPSRVAEPRMPHSVRPGLARHVSQCGLSSP